MFDRLVMLGDFKDMNALLQNHRRHPLQPLYCIRHCHPHVLG